MLVSFPNGDANGPQNTAALDALAQRMTQAPDVVTVSPPVFGNDNRSALLSAVLSVDPEDLRPRRRPSTGCAANLPSADGGHRSRVDVGGPTALIKDFDDRVASTAADGVRRSSPSSRS